MNTVGIALIALMLAAPLVAQWPDHPRPGVPRLADGSPNLSAPPPKTADGKPNLSGVWQPSPGYAANLAKDLRPGEVPFRPWAEALYNKRTEMLGKDDPQSHCVLSGVPREDSVAFPFKILNAEGMIVILYEVLHSYRQIFMDGRALPKDPNPTWMGYSSGHWEGDTLVVESSGFVENNWLDNAGHPGTESLHLTERFHRPDFGHITVGLTIDDPKAYTRPWSVSTKLTLADTELIEYVCDENEKDLPHMVGK